LISHGNSFRSALTARIEEVSDTYRNLAGWDESLKPRQKVYGFQFYPSQMLHVWNIYLYIYPKNDPYVGKYSIHGASGHGAAFCQGFSTEFSQTCRFTAEQSILGESALIDQRTCYSYPMIALLQKKNRKIN
jgi:hypothetical protein